MFRPSRRSLLQGGFATAATTAFATGKPTAGIARASSARQAPGYYRYEVGDIEVTQICDGALTFPIPGGFVVNASRDEAIAAASRAYMPDGQLTIPFNPMVIKTGSKTVLVDTGNGPGAFDATKGAVGQMQTNLAAAGIDPRSIDIVLISHMHSDHVGGLRSLDGGLSFPNAEIMVPATEWAFWMRDENTAKANTYNKTQFASAREPFEGLGDRVSRYQAGKEIAPGISSVATPGHTPGHTSFVVASGTARILVQSDVTNIPEFFLRKPDWHAAFDNDPELAAATRHRFYDMAVAEKALVVGYHFPFPAVGHVEKDGSGYRLVPVAWNSVL
jgi:glyoxylase-like metal-dependent hydrolase (beta-lactamase superfamily II)